MSTSNSESGHRAPKDLIHHPLAMLHEIAVAFSEGRRAQAAYKAHVADGIDAATAAARAVLIDKKAA